VLFPKSTRDFAKNSDAAAELRVELL